MTDKKRILLIEDDEDQRDILRTVLERDGYEIIEVDHAEAAEEYLSDNLINLIILDIALTYKNGFEFLESNIEEISSKGIKMVVTTGQSSSTINSLAEEYGCDLFFKKPINLKLLSKKIKAII